MALRRRLFLLSGLAFAGAAAVPLVSRGTEGFLRRVLSRHFGPEIHDIEGIDDFVRDYAAQAGTGSRMKRMGAEVYFAWRGDLVHTIGPAQELETLFLQTILTRSNIIALYRGSAAPFSYAGVDPWEPGCGLYLSALADEVDTTRG